MDEKTRYTIQQLATRLGLKAATVTDLLQHGWAYHEELNKMPKFEHQGPSKG